MTGLSGHELRLSAGHALTSTPAASCGPKDCRDCCNSRSEGAPTDGASPTADPATPRQARPLSCAQCGNDPNAILRAFKAGMQAVAWDTYADNVRAGELKADLEAQWHAHVRRYGE